MEMEQGLRGFYKVFFYLNHNPDDLKELLLDGKRLTFEQAVEFWIQKVASLSGTPLENSEKKKAIEKTVNILKGFFPDDTVPEFFVFVCELFLNVRWLVASKNLVPKYDGSEARLTLQERSRAHEDFLEQLDDYLYKMYTTYDLYWQNELGSPRTVAAGKNEGPVSPWAYMVPVPKTSSVLHDLKKLVITELEKEQAAAPKLKRDALEKRLLINSATPTRCLMLLLDQLVPALVNKEDGEAAPHLTAALMSLIQFDRNDEILGFKASYEGNLKQTQKLYKSAPQALERARQYWVERHFV